MSVPKLVGRELFLNTFPLPRTVRSKGLIMVSVLYILMKGLEFTFVVHASWWIDKIQMWKKQTCIFAFEFFLQ